MKPSSAMLGAAAFFAAGLLVTHHFLKPADRVVYREREGAKAEASRDAKTEQAAAATDVQQTVSVATNHRRSKRVVVDTKPTGEKRVEVVEVDEAAVAAMAEQRAQELVALTLAEEREKAKAEVLREVDLRVREPELPRWSLGGGATSDGLKPDGGYASAGVRIVGPLWARCQLARISRADGAELRWSCGAEVQF